MERDEQANSRSRNSAGDEENELEQTKRRAQEIPEQSKAEAMIMLLTDEVIESFGGAEQLLSSLKSLMNKLRNVPGEQVQ